MKIEAQTPADVTALTIKRNKAHDGQEAFVDLEIGIDSDDALMFGGEAFATLAFSSMREDKDGIVHLQETIKPSSKIVHENHVISINKHEFKAAPTLVSLRTIEATPRVVAKYRIAIETTEASLLKELTAKVGEVVMVEFSPSQQELPLEGRQLSVVDDDCGSDAQEESQVQIPDEDDGFENIEGDVA